MMEKSECKVDLSKESMKLENFRLGRKYLMFEALAKENNSVIYYGVEKQSMEERVFKFYNFEDIEERTNFTHREIIKRGSKVEWKLLRNCESVHVLTCLDVYEDRDHRVQVYQYCPTSLKEEITTRKNKSISETRAILILRQILLGLKSFHRGPKQLHTNLDPKDIMIKNGIYKIAHSGLPTMDEQEELSLLVAPEVLKRTFYDSKAEVWNIGILFHQILLGVLPSVYNKRQKTMIELQSMPSIFSREEYADNNLSPEVEDFLERCLIPDTSKRMTWLEMQSHPMFSLLKSTSLEEHPKEKKLKKEEKRGKMSVILPLEDVEEGDSEGEIHKIRFNWDKIKKEMLNELQNQYQREGEMFEIEQLESSSLQNLKEKINRVESIFYTAMKRYYVRCLKVEFIFDFILKPLAQTELKDERHWLQLMNLIIGSCFSTISKVKVEYRKCQKKTYQALIWACIDKETGHLYDQVQKTMKKLGDELTAVEDRAGSMVSDFLSKLLKSEEVKRKDNFLNGIQQCDYSPTQKIEFTEEVWKKLKDEKIQESILKKEEVKEALNYMKKYKKIWEISEDSDIEQNYPSLKKYIDSCLFQKDYSLVYA